jgi:Phage integrase family
MTVLKHILRRAVESEYLSRNPFLDGQDRPLAGLRALKEPAGRTRFLSVEEIERLLVACEISDSPYLRPFVVVAINSGMRRNEILSLNRHSVDLANSIATLTDTKNGEARHVYLNRAALDRSSPCRFDSTVACSRSVLIKPPCSLFGQPSEPGWRTSGCMICGTRSRAIKPCQG